MRTAFRSFWSRCRGLWRRRRFEAEMAEEMRAHLEVLTEANLAAGMPPEEARLAAQKRFGGIARIEEECREERGWVRLEQMHLDFRHAMRRVARSPSFALAVVVSLALGIGSAAAIFRVTAHLFFQEAELPAGVYVIGGTGGDGQFMPVRFDLMTRAYEQTSAMSEYAKAAVFTGNVVVEKQPVGTAWMGITPNLFPMLGVVPAWGRGFAPDEANESRDHVVILGNRFWHQHFNGSPTVLGRKVAVCTIVGILGDRQALPAMFDADIYRPLVYHEHPKQPWNPALLTLGRLSPGLTREQAQEILQAAQIDFPIELAATFGAERVTLVTLAEANGKLVRLAVYWVSVAAVGFLYAISCLNASNLALARMLGQRRELSIRLAMGSGRWRVVRLLLFESLILSVVGSLGGILVAHWVFPLLLRFTGEPFPMGWANISLGWRVFTLLGVLTVFTSLCIVVIPAYRILRTDIYPGLKESGAALGESRPLRRLQSSLVVLQAAFAVVLLMGAGLMVRTVENLQRIDLGFDPVNRVKVSLGFPIDYPSDGEVRLQRLHEMQERLQRVPGIASAEFGNDTVMSGGWYDTHTLESSDGRRVRGGLSCSSRDYLKSLGVSLKRGRWFAESRSGDVLVNESLARALWPGKDPIGQILRETPGVGDGTAKWVGHQVVGVVGDVRSSLRRGVRYEFYGDENWMPWNYNTFILHLRDPANEAVLSAIRRELYAFDPRIVVDRVVPMETLRDSQIGTERVIDSVLKVLAGIAAPLTMVGLFSILAYAVDRRMNEFGVRMALGATRVNVMSLVIRHGLVLAGVGLAIGVGCAMALGRGLAAILYGTSALDPWVLVEVSGILLLASVVSCALPSYRASKVDITRLLRAE